MNKKHLGDAYDYWKGSLIRILNDKNIIHNIAVEPMITDDKRWGKTDLQSYRKLLNLRSQSTIFHENSTFLNWQKKRQQYFQAIQHNGDLFIDPDIGIEPPKSTLKKEHIALEEIKQLLDNKRVLMIYQHSNPTSGWAKVKEDMILENIHGIHCYLHESGQVAMIFISWDKGRIEDIQKTLMPYKKII